MFKETHRPKLSLIVPVYNVRDYVGQCLRSILDGGADEAMYELIVVNDGTPDDSMSVVREVVDGHKNVTVIEQENQGLSAARMAGLSKAEGEYVWFVDSDDWLERDAIKVMLEEMDAHPGCDVIAQPLRWSYADEKKNRWDYGRIESTVEKGRDILRYKWAPCWAVQRFLIKREMLRHASLFFPRNLIHEDEYFGRVLLYLAPKVLLLNRGFYNYRQRAGSIMAVADYRSGKSMTEIYRILNGFCKSQVESPDREWFQRDCFENLLLYKYKELSSQTDLKDFRRLRREEFSFIWSEYKRINKEKSLRHLAIDFFVLMFPFCFVPRENR